MNCEQIQEQLVPYVLGELNENENTIIQVHLESKCESCCAELNETYRATEIIFSAVTPEKISDSLQRSILKQASADSSEVKSKPSSLSRGINGQNIESEKRKNQNQELEPYEANTAVSCHKKRGHFAHAIAFGVSTAAGFLLPFAIQNTVSGTKDLEIPMISSQQKSQQAIASQERLVPDLRALNEAGKRTHFVAARHSDSELDPSGISANAVVDSIANQIHFYGTNFPAAPLNFEYVLWSRSLDDHVQRLIPLEIDNDGSCRVTTLLSAGVKNIFVTLEATENQTNLPNNRQQLVFDLPL